MTVLPEHPTRTYPLPWSESDHRFDAILVEVVTDLLHHHGYPFINDGPDFDALANALHGFLYGTPLP